MHCVGELGVRASRVPKVGELASDLIKVGFDGVLEGVVGGVVESTLGVDVKVDGRRHLPGVLEAGQRLYVYDGALLALSVRARFTFRAGQVRAYTSHSQPSTPRRAVHTARGLQRVVAEHGKRLALS